MHKTVDELEEMSRDEFTRWMAYLALIGESPQHAHQKGIENGKRSKEFRALLEAEHG